MEEKKQKQQSLDSSGNILKLLDVIKYNTINASRDFSEE